MSEYETKKYNGLYDNGFTQPTLVKEDNPWNTDHELNVLIREKIEKRIRRDKLKEETD